MVGQIATILAGEHINITDLINQSRDEYAYNIIDTEQKISDAMLKQIYDIDGVIRVRVIEK